MAVNNNRIIPILILILCIVSGAFGSPTSLDSIGTGALLIALLIGVALTISIIFVMVLCVGKRQPSPSVVGNGSVPGTVPPSRNGNIPMGTIPSRNGHMPPGTMSRSGSVPVGMGTVPTRNGHMPPGTMNRSMSVPNGAIPQGTIPGPVPGPVMGNGSLPPGTIRGPVPGQVPLTNHDMQLQALRQKQIPDRYTFPRQNLTFLKELGVGQYGVVHLAKALGMSNTHQWLTKMVAVKTVKANARAVDKVNFLHELDLMKKLKPHPHVITLTGCCVEKEPFLIIVEYVQNGNLLQLLESSRAPFIAGPNPMQQVQQPPPRVDQRTLLRMAKDVANGMAHLASQKCIHRDLAARNVLVGADFTCKVSDFGRAIVGTYVVDSGIKFEGPLPLRWMAIESLMDDVHTSASDAWGFGVLLWEITTLGARPYGGMGPRQVVEYVRQGFRMEKPIHCGADVYSVMMACWSTDPVRRPSFPQLSSDLRRILDLKTDFVYLNRIDRRIYDGDRTFLDPFEKMNP